MKKSKVVGIVLAVVLFAIIGGFFLFSDVTPSCYPYLDVVAKKLGVPISEVHTCEVEKTTVGDEEYAVISSYYGELQDCMSGCFYAFSHFAIRESDNSFFDLPSPVGGINYFQFPLPKIQNQSLPGWLELTWDQMQCDNVAQVEQGLKRRLAIQNGHIGYEVRLNTPLVCTWEDTKSQVFSQDYESSIVVSDDVVTEWSGTVFHTVSNLVPDIQLREISRTPRTYTIP